MAGQIALLKAELDNDPFAVGYSTMTNVEVVASINAVVISKNKASIAITELFSAIDPTELLALTGDKATRVWGLLGMDSIDPFGVAASILVNSFGSGSATITALKALRKENISRANQLGYPGVVKEGHVQMARARV